MPDKYFLIECSKEGKECRNPYCIVNKESIICEDEGALEISKKVVFSLEDDFFTGTILSISGVQSDLFPQLASIHAKKEKLQKHLNPLNENFNSSMDDLNPNFKDVLSVVTDIEDDLNHIETRSRIVQSKLSKLKSIIFPILKNNNNNKNFLKENFVPNLNLKKKEGITCNNQKTLSRNGDSSPKNNASKHQTFRHQKKLKRRRCNYHEKSVFENEAEIHSNQLSGPLSIKQEVDNNEAYKQEGKSNPNETLVQFDKDSSPAIESILTPRNSPTSMSSSSSDYQILKRRRISGDGSMYNEFQETAMNDFGINNSIPVSIQLEQGDDEDKSESQKHSTKSDSSTECSSQIAATIVSEQEKETRGRNSLPEPSNLLPLNSEDSPNTNRRHSDVMQFNKKRDKINVSIKIPLSKLDQIDAFNSPRSEPDRLIATQNNHSNEFTELSGNIFIKSQDKQSVILPPSNTPSKTNDQEKLNEFIDNSQLVAEELKKDCHETEMDIDSIKNQIKNTVRSSSTQSTSPKERQFSSSSSSSSSTSTAEMTYSSSSSSTFTGSETSNHAHHPRNSRFHGILQLNPNPGLQVGNSSYLNDSNEKVESSAQCPPQPENSNNRSFITEQPSFDDSGRNSVTIKKEIDESYYYIVDIVPDFLNEYSFLSSGIQDVRKRNSRIMLSESLINFPHKNSWTLKYREPIEGKTVQLLKGFSVNIDKMCLYEIANASSQTKLAKILLERTFTVDALKKCTLRRGIALHQGALDALIIFIRIFARLRRWEPVSDGTLTTAFQLAMNKSPEGKSHAS